MKYHLHNKDFSAYKFLAILTLLVLLGVNLFNISQPILEEHGFRQTQTALTAYYLQVNGFSFSYETPVVGEPWAIPFEFPIYQEIVALFSLATSINLTIIGRAVNIFFIVMTCIPLAFILKINKIHKSAIYGIIALYLSTPLYLFWAGTFMIEGAVLFFTFSFLYYSLELNSGNLSKKNLLLFFAFLLLAALQKITTALPVVLVVMLYSFLNWLVFNKGEIRYRLAIFIKIAFLVIIAMSIAMIWVRYSDIVKLENPIGAKLTSKALRGWNFGTLTQRVSKDFWQNIVFYRNVWPSSLGYFGVVIIALGLIFIKTTRVKILIITSLTLFLLPFLFFPNLHAVHNYYQTANLVFYVIALGLSLFYLIDSKVVLGKYVLPFLIIIFIGWNYYNFSREYLPKKMLDLSGHRTLQLGKFIDENTPKEAAVIWLGGYDWSSEVAFYSNRKSLTVPPWSGFEFEAIKHTNKFLSKQPSAFVLCPSPNFDGLIEEMRRTYPSFKLKELGGCRIYLRE